MASSRKLNVLVYTGAGSTVESVKHAVYTLRRLLSPNYAVIPITETVLLKEPWAATCALLVFPGGADLGYCKALDGHGNALISQYVRRGGAYLGFCAGGYYGSKRCEFEVGDKYMEVIGSRELAFYPATCRGCAFKGFQYRSEKGARATPIRVNREEFTDDDSKLPQEFACYYNGGGIFVGANDNPDVEVLASYADPVDVDGGQEKAAVVYCKVGQGAALLTGPHPEFAAANLSRQNDVPYYDALIAKLQADDNARTKFLQACLARLGLEVNQDTASVPSLSKLHLSSIVSDDVNDLLCALQDVISKEDGEEYIRGENDIFHLEKQNTRWAINGLKQALPPSESPGGPTDAAAAAEGESQGIVDYTAVRKTIVTHDESWPDVKETPYFNHHAFYNGLKEYRSRDREAEEWGDHFMYGEVVTSTNTLLEKNFKLLSKLPSGFTLAATTQISGRGRGTNVWIAPPGCLIMSTVINHPAELIASRPIVFLQYLAGVATVQAIKTYDAGYDAVPVRLKWPNDIYARDPTRPASSSPDSPASYVKIGGVLSNCAYAGGAYQVVLGIGINTNNGRPTTSLDRLLPPHLAPFSIERLTARILTRLEALYKEFARRGFTRDLERAYYDAWLHGRQVVSLEAEGGARARIVGITPDWGMLRAEELDGPDDRPTGRVWALQSDENSFDFFKGLVKRKI